MSYRDVSQIDRSRPVSFRKSACIRRVDTVKLKGAVLVSLAVTVLLSLVGTADEWEQRNIENKVLVAKMKKDPRGVHSGAVRTQQ